MFCREQGGGEGEGGWDRGGKGVSKGMEDL